MATTRRRTRRLLILVGAAVVVIVVAVVIVVRSQAPSDTFTWDGKAWNCHQVLTAPFFTAQPDGTLARTYPLPVLQGCENT